MNVTRGKGQNQVAGVLVDLAEPLRGERQWFVQSVLDALRNRSPYGSLADVADIID
jgi:hypothetical protein